MKRNLSLKAKCCLSLLIGLGLSLCLGVSVAQAQCPNSRCYVDADVTLTATTGMTWTLAFTNLQDALAVAADGTEIWVAEGVYYPDEGRGQTNDNHLAHFALKDGVKIYGGFAATETERSQRQPKANVTVLSGDIDRNDITDSHGVVTATDNISGTNAYHVIHNIGVSRTAVLDGFTITAGHADHFTKACPGACGGGMLNYSSHPEISQVSFSGNRAVEGGGMLNHHGSRPQISQVSFSGNSASNFGGGMHNADYNSRPVISQVSFSGNSARNGGGMSNSYNQLEISQVSFSGNSASLLGGGMFNSDSHPQISQVSFRGNYADTQGGGMFNSDSHPQISQASFSGNLAGLGGGMYNQRSSPVISQASFSGNYASSWGGGMISNSRSHPQIVNSIFWGNADPVRGMGARAQILADGNMMISDTLVQGSSVIELYGITWRSRLENGGGHNLLDVDPLFREPINPFLAPTSAGNLRLRLGSTAINAGDDLAASGPVDLEGAPRIHGAGVDLGAYETPLPDISLSKAVSPAIVESGQRVTYTLVLSNSGVVSDDVRLTDTLPSGVEFAAWGAQGGAMENANEISWQGPVTVGESITITFGVINLISGGIINNRTQFSGNFQTGSSSVSHGVFRQRVYVDADVTLMATDGMSWTTAYTNLQDALAVAIDGTEIWVAAGVYYPDEGGGQTNNDVRASFTLNYGVKLYGGFAGTETSRSQRQPRVNLTVLSGDIDRNDQTDGQGVVTAAGNISGSNAYNVIRNIGVGRTAVLDGFTITAGHARGGGCPGSCGGGMYNHINSNPVINQISFRGNHASFGGGMFNDGGNPEMSQVSFSGNQADDSGGGMFNDGGNPEMSQVSFSGNRAGFGGGMFNEGSNPEMSQVSFSGNYAADSGGGMFNDKDSRPEIVNSIFWGNVAGRQMTAQIHNSDSGSNPVISYTLIQGSGGSGSAWESSLGRDGGHNLDADPLFREPIKSVRTSSPTAGNLRLKRGSPAINAGDNRAASGPLDLAGAPRIQGGRVDLGAYEAEPLVSLSKAVSPALVEAGQRVTYTLVLSNSGAVSDSVRLSDTLPSGVEFAAWVAQRGAVENANEVSWQGTVPTGESISITFVVTNLNSSSAITNRAQFSGSRQTGSSSVSHSVFRRRFHVDVDVRSPLPDGLSWRTAYPNLQDALAVAVDGDEIWVAEGVYYPDEGGGQSNNNRGASFALKNGVKIYGGFAGTETERSQRQPSTNVTVLSGDIDGDDIKDGQGVVRTATGNIRGANAYHVIRNIGVSRTAVLDGFTITAGNADAAGFTCPDSCGGGMYNIRSSPEINQISFRGNSATSSGGGMFNNDSSNPKISQVSFSGNSAAGGGGMFNHDSSNPKISQVSFSGNRAVLDGGGMFNGSSNPEISQASFSGNSASYGGGMYNHDSSNPKISQASFSGNSAANSGGGMYNGDNNSPKISQVSFSGNRARWGGGMYNESLSHPQIVNSIFWGNAAGMAEAQIWTDHSLQISYTLIQGSGGGGNNLDADPLFQVPINPADAPTTAGNLRLKRGSPAINAGDNRAASGPLDLAGAPRIQGVRVDLGAYETAAPQISLSKAVSPAMVDSGQRVTYTLALSNSGLVPDYIRLTDTLPSGVEFAAWVEQGGAKMIADDIRWEGIVTAAESISITFGVTNLNLSRAIINRAQFDSTFQEESSSVSHTVLRRFYVDADGISPLPDGLSWRTAYPNLQDALAEAADGDEIWVAEGVYYPDEGRGQTNDDVTASFAMKNGVEIYGGFAGTETSRSQRQPRANVTVLSGDIDRNDVTDGQGVVRTTANIAGLNASHVIRNSDVNSTAVLDGFTITAGYANVGGLCPNNCGGGMLNIRSSPVITQISFSGHHADANGGGMVNWENSHPKMSQVSFSGNTVNGNGGGMFNSHSSRPEMSQVSFSGNRSHLGLGGGMYNQVNSHPAMSQVSFSGNSAQNGGGGMVNHDSSPHIVNSIFWGNEASNLINARAQIYNFGVSSPTIRYTLVQSSGGSGRAWESGLGMDGGNNLDADPLFREPINPADFPTSAGNLRLERGCSPAIDAGDDPAASGPEDLEGATRIQGAGVDLGAYESRPAACISLSKAVSPAMVKPDQRVTYTLVLSNSGAVSDSVRLSNTLPSGVEFAAWVAQGGAVITANEISWQGTVTAGESISIIFGVSNLNLSGPITNRAQFSGSVQTGSSSVSHFVSNVSPLAADDTYSTDEDTPLTIISPTGVLSNDGDLNGDRLTATVQSDVSSGTLDLQLDGSFVYTPLTHFNGLDYFSYQVSDGVLSDTALVTITIAAVNDAPVARDDRASTNEDEAVSISVLSNDTDVDNSRLSLAAVSPAQSGTTSISGQQVVYSPSLNFAGTDSFTYRVFDGSLSDTASVTVTVNAVNDAPLAVAGADQSVRVSQSVTLDGSGSRDVEGDALGYGWQQTGGVRVTLNRPSLSRTTFTAPADPTILTFRLSVTDGQGLASRAAQVVITVTDEAIAGLRAQNSSPIAAQETVTVTAHITAGTNVSYAWSFGDGGNAVGQIATYVYTQAGTYTATVVASNSINSLTATTRVTIKCPNGRCYVDANVMPPVISTGLSWRTAYTNLQDALAVARNGDEIWVAAGVYYPDEGGGQTNNDRGASFVLTDGVKIYGGFAGTETSRSQRQPRVKVTVLSGDIDGDDIRDGQGVVTTTDNINGSNAYHVIRNSGVGRTAVLDGFTITAGDARGGGDCPDDCGGGMFNDSSSPQLTQISFRGNSARFGGGMYNNNNSRPEMSQVSFSGNSAAHHGGGMFNKNNSRPEMSQVSFSGNRAATSGGGMFNSNGHPEMSQVSFSGNFAFNGGGMFNAGSNPHIVNSIFWGNAANGLMDASAQITNSSGSTPVISYTLIQSSGGSGLAWESSLGRDGGNNLDADPLFREPIDPAQAPTRAGNLRLEPGSPAIDVGDDRAARDDVDLAGATRIQGAGVDLGAYERAGPYINLNKAVSPVRVEPDQRVTYTLVLSNSGLLSDSVRLSDPLPSGVEFAAWVAQGGAVENANEISWRGTVTTGESISITFEVSNLNLSGPITNRAQFSGSLQTGSSSASYTVLNVPPLAADDTYSTTEDIPLTIISPTGVLSNDGDLNGDSLMASVESVGRGTLDLQLDGSFVYTPAADVDSQDHFSYQISDGVLTDTASVTIIIRAVNDAPVAFDDTARANEDVAVSISVLSNDTDVDNSRLSLAAVSPAQSGTTSISGQQVVYSPNLNFVGTDSFTYSVSDGSLSDMASVTVTVNAVNDAPVAEAGADQSVRVSQSVTLDGSLSSDVEGDALSYGWQQTGGVNVTLNRPSLSRTTFTAPALPTVLTFSLSVTDGQGLASRADEVVITVKDEAIAGLRAQNSSPIAVHERVTFTAHITAGTNVSYAWDFGDGGNAVGQEVTHIYTQARTYTARVEASNSSNILTATTRVTITDEAIAGLSVQNSSPTAANEVVTFTAQITAGEKVSYTWDFGDGGNAVGQTATHVYTQAGTYTARVEASNSTNSLTATTRVTIKCPNGRCYVDANVMPPVIPDGMSWRTAYTNLQDALAVARNGDEIWVAAGVYYPDEGGGQTKDDVRASFALTDGVEIYGGFAATETARSQRQPRVNVTVLSGDIDGNDGTDSQGVVTTTANITGSNAYHVIFNRDVSSTAVLDGFTITAGDVNVGGVCPDNNNCGGGMYNIRSSPVMSQISFSGNRAGAHGGGMVNWDNSHPKMRQVSFSGNRAAVHGGGMLNSASSPEMSQVSFSGNRASLGGGMFNQTNSNPKMSQVSFSGNSAANSGGGMFNTGSQPHIVNSIFWGNAASGLINAPAQIHNSGGSSPAISYTLIQSSGGSSAWESSLGDDGGNNLDADPLFREPIDPADAPTSAGNLRLEPGSPAIDAGDDRAASGPVDLDGTPRIQGARVDLGAYERRPRPDISLSKAVSPVMVEPDQRVTYTLVLSNSGLGSDSVRLSDTLPSGVEFAAWGAQGGARENANEISWQGTLTVGESISITFGVSNRNLSGPITNRAQFSGSLQTGSSSVSHTVLNVSPLAADDTYSTDEDTRLTIISPTGVLSNDGDLNGDSLMASVQSDVSRGTLDLKVDGSFVYTPAAQVNGLDYFSYQVSDGVLSDTASVTIIIRAVNDAPVAFDDTASTKEDEAVSISVLSNDADVDNSNLSLVAANISAQNGRTSISGQQMVYSPSLNFEGTDSFTYSVSDGSLSDTASVTVTVQAVNDGPVAIDDTASTNEDEAVSISVLSNDVDIEDDSLSLVAANISAQNGRTSISGQQMVYSPSLNFEGTDSFTYRVSDGRLSDTALVTITIRAVNDAPVALDDRASTAEDEAVSISVLSNDADVENDSLSLTAVSPAQNGRTSISGQQMVYSPNLNFVGTDSFTYRVSDGSLSDTASVTVTVQAVNDGPVARDDTVSTKEDEAVSISVLSNDADVDNSSLSLVAANISAQSGRTSISGQQVVYSPNLNFAGTDSFTYSVSDGSLSDTASVTVTVEAVNDAPLAEAGADQSVRVSQSVTLDGSRSRDVEGDALRYGWQQTGGASVTLNRPSLSRTTFIAPATPTILTFRLSVTDEQGLVSRADEVVITVTDEAIAGLSVQNTSPVRVQERVTVTAHILAGTNVSYTWDFGDGEQASGTSAVSHVYPQAGTYTVRVVASNSINTLTATTVVSITPIIGFRPEIEVSDYLSPVLRLRYFTAYQGVAYSYTVKVSPSPMRAQTPHLLETQIYRLSAPQKPAWLDFVDHQDNTGILRGMPGAAHQSEQAVTILARDGQVSSTAVFTITVEPNQVYLPLVLR